MMMRLVVNVDAQRAPMGVHLLHDPSLNERMKRLVNGGKRDGGSDGMDSSVKLFRTRMFMRRHQHVVDDLALASRRESPLMAQSTERRFAFLSCGWRTSCWPFCLHTAFDVEEFRKIQNGE